MSLDWTAYHAAIVAESRSVALVGACARTLAWVALEPEARADAVAAHLESDNDVSVQLEAFSLVRAKSWRDAGVDVTDAAAFQDALAVISAGGATGALAAAARTVLAIGELWPQFEARRTATQAAAQEEVARLERATREFSAVAKGCRGPASPAVFETLRRATADLDAAGHGLGPVAAREHAWWRGLASWHLASVARDIGRFDEARAYFEQSAAHYDFAGEAGSAGECREAARSLAHRVQADVDAASIDDLQQMLSNPVGLDRVGVLLRLASTAGDAGDRFEADRLATEAAALLVSLGYPDPEPADAAEPETLERVLQQWLDTATASKVGPDLSRLLADVTRHWAGILGARANAHMTRDRDRSDHAERVMRALASTFPLELNRQATAASEAAAARLAEWTVATVPLEVAEPQGADSMAAQNAVHDALFALRQACDQAPDPAMLDAADRLLAQAESAGLRVAAANALLERAYILHALGRFDEVPAATDRAAHRLLDGRTAGLGAFATASEREIYLRTVVFHARSCAALGNHDGILAACLPLLAEIEAERERVNDPYQKSAVLSSRTEVYELVAAAARRAGRWDLLLDTTERLKARASLAGRMPGAGLAEETEAYREWRAVNDALGAAQPGDVTIPALQQRRRWLSTLVAIERARRAGLPAAATVAALQQGLDADEAAVSWFWIRSDVLFVQTFTTDQRDVTVVVLDDDQKQSLDEFLTFVTSAHDLDPEDDAAFARFDALVDALGSVLLPTAVRERLAGRPRLVFSPHRSLHLFPFHAVPWSSGGRSGRLVEFSAVRYAPNLTSLLLPWEGSTDGHVLAVGISRFDDPRKVSLPGAEAEAEAVAGIHGARGQFLPRPDRATFAARLANETYRCLHLATHGSSVLHGEAADDPRLSSLSLRDGDLSAWDLSALDLRAELVVLAACHSGQRAVAGRGLDSLPGDDLFGLQAVLFEAGAWSVLGTLWPVDDETAREVMTAFHREYATGARPDVALQRALARYLADPDSDRSPFTWAPFVLATLGRHPGSPIR